MFSKVACLGCARFRGCFAPLCASNFFWILLPTVCHCLQPVRQQGWLPPFRSPDSGATLPETMWLAQ
eukprot:10034157-Prorocentrum_lima.AAC.1